MLKNYLTVALRSLRRRKGYAFINVFGLALGIACCGLIGLYVVDELSYDRHHADADRIFRIVRAWEEGVNGEPPLVMATTSPPIVPLLREQFPQVRDGFRLATYGEASVRHGEEEFREDRLYYAEPAVFDVLTLPLLKGDPESALAEPFTLVLSESTARKYFGDVDPVGETLTLYGEDDFRVTGVMVDTPPQSHVHFDFLASWASLESWFDLAASDDWSSNYVYSYVRLSPEDADRVGELEAQFATFMDRHEPEGNETVLRLQPLTDIHLRSRLAAELEPGGGATTVGVFAAIAVLVLLLACVNFTNLATARGAERAKEVGVRKAVGAQRGQLARQFLTESLVLAAAALLLGGVLLRTLLPAFEGVAGKALGSGFGPGFVLGFVALALLAGFAAGAYPALYLSGLRPARTLRGQQVQGRGGAALRKGLVVFQFAASIALLAGTAVVYDQLTFLKQKALGFDQERVVEVELPDDATIARGGALADAFERVSGVRRVAFSSTPLPSGLGSRSSFWRLGAGRAEGQGVNFRTIRTGAGFADALGVEVVAGRYFSEARPADTAAVVLNETAARMLGVSNPAEAVGQLLEPSADAVENYGPQQEVVGVVRDFHLGTLEEAVPAVGFFYEPDPMWQLLVRLADGDPAPAVAGLEAAWDEVVGGRPFEYAFADDRFDALYRAEEQAGHVLLLFTTLAIAIACLGLLGLAAFAAARRTKEIGVRKVLGASVTSIVGLLSADFARLVLVAAALAVPLAYLGAQRWLEGFAYRIELGAGPFVLAAGAALLVALLTVSYQALQAASADPVKALRSE